MPTVSAIIPAYNAEQSIAGAIDSVLAQTHRDLELIVIDDGSTDRTAEIVRTYGSRIHVHRQPNSGPSAARNAGARLAAGEWVAFLDADDEWEPDKIERQLLLGDAPCVYSDRINVGVLGDYSRRQSDGRFMAGGDIFELLLLQGNFITASSVIMRRALLEALGGFASHLRVCEDWDLWLRVAAAHRIALLKEPVVRYRVSPSSSSGNFREMARAREVVVGRALSSPRGRALPWATRRRVWAETYRTNGWDANRRGAVLPALREYVKAAAAWPVELETFKGAIRVLMPAAVQPILRSR